MFRSRLIVDHLGRPTIACTTGAHASTAMGRMARKLAELVCWMALQSAYEPGCTHPWIRKDVQVVQNNEHHDPQNVLQNMWPEEVVLGFTATAKSECGSIEDDSRKQCEELPRDIEECAERSSDEGGGELLPYRRP